MKAAVVHDFTRSLSLEEVAKPKPGPGEVLVKIETAGLCHTDIHAAHGDWPVKPALPLIPGTKASGSSRRSARASPRRTSVTASRFHRSARPVGPVTIASTGGRDPL